MNINQNKIFLAGGGILITMFFLLPILSPYFRESFLTIIRNYPFAAPLTIIAFRFLGVVIAPLPGLPIAFASMTLLPWWEAWLYNMTGTMSGAIVAFYIARVYRERVVAYIVPLQKVHQWQESISQKKQWWTFAALRLVSLSMFDFIAYGAGLSKISFATYLSTLLIIDIPISLAFFYFGGIAIQYSIYLFVGFTIIFALSLGWLQYSKKNVLSFSRKRESRFLWIRFILNLPYTLFGFIMGIVSIPHHIEYMSNPYAITIKVKSFWWAMGYMKGMRAATIGHTILLGSHVEDGDLKHELIHVQQYQRLPFIYPILYYIELWRRGYRNNKYEVEAYQIAGNIYKSK